jgi:MYXO-CTERM domain-containing protein
MQFSAVYFGSFNSIDQIDSSAAFAFSGDITGFTATSAPELSTWAMLLIGFAGIGFAARRRRITGTFQPG